MLASYATETKLGISIVSVRPRQIVLPLLHQPRGSPNPIDHTTLTVKPAHSAGKVMSVPVPTCAFRKLGCLVTISTIAMVGCGADGDNAQDILFSTVEIVDEEGTPVGFLEFDYHFDMWINNGTEDSFSLFYVRQEAMTNSAGVWSERSLDLDSLGTCYTYCTILDSTSNHCAQYLDGCYNPASIINNSLPSVRIYPFDVEDIDEIRVALVVHLPSGEHRYTHPASTSISEPTSSGVFRRVDRFVLKSN